jgi:hypothetical protein
VTGVTIVGVFRVICGWRGWVGVTRRRASLRPGSGRVTLMMVLVVVR